MTQIIQPNQPPQVIFSPGPNAVPQQIFQQSRDGLQQVLQVIGGTTKLENAALQLLSYAQTRLGEFADPAQRQALIDECVEDAAALLAACAERERPGRGQPAPPPVRGAERREG